MAGQIYVVPYYTGLPNIEFNHSYDSIDNYTADQRTIVMTTIQNGIKYYDSDDGSLIRRRYLLSSKPTYYIAAYKNGSNKVSIGNKHIGNSYYYDCGYKVEDGVTSYIAISTYYSQDEIVMSSYQHPQSAITLTPFFDNYQDCYTALSTLTVRQIFYNLTNCTTPGAPTQAEVGEQVRIVPSFPAGYGVVNPETDAYVMCNGVLVNSTWANGALTFTMPNPDL